MNSVGGGEHVDVFFFMNYYSIDNNTFQNNKLPMKQCGCAFSECINLIAPQFKCFPKEKSKKCMYTKDQLTFATAQCKTTLNV